MRTGINIFLDIPFWGAWNDDNPWQFTSYVWSQLCQMLNIMHRQMTACHPKANAAVERLHCCLKDVLLACAIAATWTEELPCVLFRLSAQPREDTGLSHAEAVFGTPVVLPNVFLHGEEISVDMYTMFLKTLDAPAFPHSRSIIRVACCLKSCHPNSFAPPSSGCAKAALSPLSSAPMTAPMLSCAGDPALSPSESGQGTRLSPSAACRLARMRTPHLAVRDAVTDHQALACGQAIHRPPTIWRYLTFSPRHSNTVLQIRIRKDPYHVPRSGSFPGCYRIRICRLLKWAQQN